MFNKVRPLVRNLATVGSAFLSIPSFDNVDAAKEAVNQSVKFPGTHSPTPEWCNNVITVRTQDFTEDSVKKALIDKRRGLMEHFTLTEAERFQNCAKLTEHVTNIVPTEKICSIDFDCPTEKTRVRVSSEEKCEGVAATIDMNAAQVQYDDFISRRFSKLIRLTAWAFILFIVLL